MYSVLSYGRMIADRARTGAFAQALKKSITSQSVVLDIGTGTGIFAMLACKFGARRIFAIEPDDVIQVARQTAAANQYSQIEFIQDFSTSVTIPELANIIISDLGGLLPWFRNHISSIIDARKRLLAPGGRLIPETDTLWATIVENQEMYDFLVEGWNPDPFGLDFRQAREFGLNTFRKSRIREDQFFVEPRCWARLNYFTVEDLNISAELSWTAARAGTAHGIAVWFDRQVAEGILLSNAPGPKGFPASSIYGTAFFPWLQPVTLNSGDLISVSLKATLVGEDYVWSWNTVVRSHDDRSKIKADFKQSTFHDIPLSLQKLHKLAEGSTPSLNTEGRIEFSILQMMNGNTSLEEIARKIQGQFPEEFRMEQEAMTYVSNIALKYSN